MNAVYVYADVLLLAAERLRRLYLSQKFGRSYAASYILHMAKIEH